MLAVTASRLSPADIWRRKDEKTKERSRLESRRDRRGSKGSAETKESGEVMEISGNWRVRKQEGAKRVDESGVYGEFMPAEWKLQKMYKQLKIDNNKFTTWLVESVYPCSESLPPYVTLARKQAKDHPKYDIVVNNITELACQIEKVPTSILALLDHLIIERTEYSHWMSQKSTDDLSKYSNECHVYYIKVLKQVKNILNERMEPKTKAPFQAESPNPAKNTQVPTQKDNATLGKRRTSTTSLRGPDRAKAAKHSMATPKQQQQEWRKVVSDRCEKMVDKICAPVVKPMSYAAALRVAIGT